MTTCADWLMEKGWDAGFICTLPAGHEGPHRDESSGEKLNTGTSRNGRVYEWTFEWAYSQSW